jgi:lipopolysaccharide transport system ATP-binding protein
MSSNDLAVSVRELSKAYTIRHNVTDHVTLAEVALDRLRHPLRRAEREQLWALRAVNFDVRKGEVLGLIGPNGAGKTTLLKVLSRITEPTSGEVRLWGRVGSLLEVGTGFHPELTGRENVYLNGAVLGMNRREIDRRFDAIVEFAGVQKFLDTPIKRFSSGMQVRLAFAVAAHLETEILLLDEVLAVGDSDFQTKCLVKISALAESGRTVILVSHNAATVRQFATNALLLRSGYVVAQGPADAVLNQYAGTERDGCDDVDLIARSRHAPHLGQRARFVRLRHAHEGGLVAPDDDLRLTVEIESHEDLEGALLGQMLFAADGSVVGTSFGAPTIALRADQRAELDVQLPCPRLAPGQYSLGLLLGVSLGSAGLDDLDAVADCMQFEVEHALDSEGRVERWDKSWGPVRMSPPIVVCARQAVP